MNPFPRSDTKFKLVECGPGWDSLFYPLIRECEAAGGTVLQVKEKFGTLRFYYDLTDPDEKFATEFADRVRAAELKSSMICEMCGSPGMLRQGKWLKTLCDPDAEIRQRRMENK